MTMTSPFPRARAHISALAALFALPASLLAHLPKPRGKDDDDDDDSGGGGQTPNVAALVARAGNADAAVMQLMQENYQLRQNRRELRAQLKDATGKLPQDGTTVLTAEQAKEWGEYQKLGKPADVAKIITDGTKAIETMTTRERADHVRGVAAQVGYNPDVLAQLATMNNVEITSREVTMEGGTKVTAFYVKDGQGVETDIRAYATQNWQAFLPSLQQTQQGGQPAPGQQQPQPGQPAPGQQQAQQPGAAWMPGTGSATQPAGTSGNPLQNALSGIMAERTGQQQPNALSRLGQPSAPVGQPQVQQGFLPGGPGSPPPAGNNGQQ